MSQNKCSQKLAFDTKAKADAAKRTAAYQHGAKLKVYKCKDCKLWHLASSW